MNREWTLWFVSRRSTGLDFRMVQKLQLKNWRIEEKNEDAVIERMYGFQINKVRKK